MSLFAGTGFFTQSAVLFPTSIEKNKKTEACSRDPQASSLLHGKGRHRQPFFTRRGGKPSWGGRTAKSLRRPAPAMQICREQSAPDEGRGGGSQGRMPGQRLWGGPLLAWIPEQTPNVLIQLGSWGAGPHLIPPWGTSCCSMHRVFGKDLGQELGETQPSTLLCEDTYSHKYSHPPI